MQMLRQHPMGLHKAWVNKLSAPLCHIPGVQKHFSRWRAGMGREVAGRDGTPRLPLAPGATKPWLGRPRAPPGREVLNAPLPKRPDPALQS